MAVARQENDPTKEKLRQRKQWHKMAFFIPFCFPIALACRRIREYPQLPEKIRESIVLLIFGEMKALQLSIDEPYFDFGWNRVRQLAFGLFIKIRYLIKEQSSNSTPTSKIVSYSTSRQALMSPVAFLSTHKP